MNIDYEAIAAELAKTTGSIVCTQNIKAIIDAYEAQKKAPEWVPLDLEKVTRGQEVRRQGWDTPGQFVCMFQDGVVVRFEATCRIHMFVHTADWLMRAQKPKTVRVQVLMEHIRKELRVQLASESPPVGYWQVVGEGDIPVRE